MPIRPTAAATLLAIAGSASAATAQTAYSWAAASDGLWDISTNWSPSTAYPDLDGDTATLGLVGAYTVDLDRAIDITSIDIPNPDALLEIRGGIPLRVYDRVTNDGAVLVNSTASVFDASLAFRSGVTTPLAGFTLDGSGTVTLGAPSAHPDAKITVAAGLTLTHAATHTIDGAGQLEGDFVNNGLITSNVPTSVGIRILETVDQSGGGTLSADGADVILHTATVIGGTLSSSAGGSFVVDAGTSVLAGAPQITGTINIPGGGLTLDLASNATVDGIIDINSSLQVFNATLRFTDSATLSGDAEIIMRTVDNDTGDARIQAADGFTGTLGPDIDVHGAGRLVGDLVLQGSLDADAPGQLLEIFDTLTLSGAAIVRANGGEIGLSSATITNANLDSSAGGRVRTTNGTSLLDAPATNAGTLAVMGGGHTLEVNSTLTNNGVVQLNPDLTVFNSTLFFTGTPSIAGTGQIEMSIVAGDTNDARIESDTGVTTAIGAGQTITGAGRFVGDFTSDARIEANSAEGPLEIRGSIAQGAGAVIAADNAVLAIVNGSVTGGTLETTNNGVVTAADGANAITDLTNSGDLGIDGTNCVLAASGTIVNDGRVLVNRTAQVFNATLALADAASITGAGEINLAPGSTDFADARINVPVGAATIGAGQTITGTGRTVGDLTIHGTIAPGESVGEIQSNNGTITRTATSVYEVELALADGSSHDRISGNADHVLAGSLIVTEIEAYFPAVGDEFVIIDGGSVTGQFDSVTLPTTLPNRVYRVFYEADRVLLVHTCEGDFAPPYDVLDFSDVIVFLTAFGTGDGLADLAEPIGVFDFSDVIAFLTAFGTGCS